MTVGEACAVLIETVRDLSATRAERDSWRIVALASIQYAAELHRELEDGGCALVYPPHPYNGNLFSGNVNLSSPSRRRDLVQHGTSIRRTSTAGARWSISIVVAMVAVSTLLAWRVGVAARDENLRIAVLLGRR